MTSCRCGGVPRHNVDLFSRPLVHALVALERNEMGLKQEVLATFDLPQTMCCARRVQNRSLPERLWQAKKVKASALRSWDSLFCGVSVSPSVSNRLNFCALLSLWVVGRVDALIPPTDHC